jgi:hypothetical protein
MKGMPHQKFGQIQRGEGEERPTGKERHFLSHTLQNVLGLCPPLYWGFLITYSYTHDRTPLDECSARRRGLYLTQDNTKYKHKTQTSMTRAGFEPAFPATKLPHTYAPDRAATEIVKTFNYPSQWKRKHVNLAANLTVQGQHVSSVYIQVYIRLCTHCWTVSLILNMKHTFNDISPCFDFLVVS